MKLSKLRASTKMRHLAGTEIPRQNTTSVGMRNAMKKAGNAFAGESGAVEGSPAKMRLDRARARGGRVCREDGGSAGRSRISADSQAEATKLRERASGRLGQAAMNAVMATTGLGTAGMPRAARWLGKAVIGTNALAGISALGNRARENAEADRIERGLVTPGEEDRKDGGATDGKWIQGAIKHPGALHKELHVPEGEKIPAKKLQKAEHSDNPKLRKRAQLAETLKGLHK